MKLPIQNVCIFELLILAVSPKPKIFLVKNNVCSVTVISGTPVLHNNNNNNNNNNNKECEAIVYISQDN